jgi:chemotaxis family two-component system response regulator Rcp1
MKKPIPRPNKTKSENPARIVLIEDNPGDVYFMRAALDEQQRAYTLHVLYDGAEALRFVREQRAVAGVEPQPCVIVLDLHLPKHDGTEVLRAIKQEPLLSHVHVVVLTSVVRPEDEMKVRQLGVRLYRRKPSDLDEFAQVARSILEICGERSVVSASTAL